MSHRRRAQWAASASEATYRGVRVYTQKQAADLWAWWTEPFGEPMHEKSGDARTRFAAERAVERAVDERMAKVSP